VIRFGSSVSPPASPPMSMPPALRWPIPAPDPAAPIFWTALLSAQRRGPRWGGPGPRDGRSGSLAFLKYAEVACKTGGLPVLLSPVPQVAASAGVFQVFAAVLRVHGLFGGEPLAAEDPTHAEVHQEAQAHSQYHAHGYAQEWVFVQEGSGAGAEHHRVSGPQNRRRSEERRVGKEWRARGATDD